MPDALSESGLPEHEAPWFCIALGHSLPGWETDVCWWLITAQGPGEAEALAREVAADCMDAAAERDGEHRVATPDSFVFLNAERI